MQLFAPIQTENKPPLCKPVKCPLCGRGRICDVTSDITVNKAQIPINSAIPAIYVKCKCCGQLIGIHV